MLQCTFALFGYERSKRARSSVRSSFSPPFQIIPSKRQALSPTPMSEDTGEDELLSVSVGEPFLSDYNIHELPGDHEDSDEILVSVAHMACIEAFLGPAVNNLHYWGTSTHRTGKWGWKLDPKNQFFLTLVRLRLNIRVKDLSIRFRISVGLISRYITTWICFLYHHLREIEWMPTPQQVAANLPHVFKEKYPTTFAIIDPSEIFIETPSDLHMQSLTWSDYKHHNTAKFLVACTPNGAISFVSPLYVGAISDVELTLEYQVL